MKRIKLLGGALTFVLSCNVAQAGVILGPVGISSTLGDYSGHVIGQTIDQSGMSISYVSGVTDFDSYVASATSNSQSASTIWASPVGVTSGSVTFDLGGAQTVSSLAMWGRDQSSFGVKDFSLFISDTSNFAVSTLLGNFTALQNTGGTGAATGGQAFDFTATSGAFVRMDIANNYGSVLVEVGEFAFESSASVPAPATLSLLGLGLAGLRFRRRQIH